MNLHPVYGPSLPEAGWVPAPRYLLRRNRILALLQGQPPGLYLEIGCGPGALMFDLCRRGFECQALETSPTALRLARELHASDPEVAIFEQEQADWQGHFDYLGAFEVLEHIDDDRSALESWKAWLKPGGMLLLSVPAHQHKWNATDEWAGHFRRYGQAQLRSLLGAAGFEVLRFESYGVPLANLIEPIRARHHARQLQAKAGPEGDAGQVEIQERTEQSGVSRSLEARLYPLQRSLPGVLAMRTAFGLQRLFLSSDRGVGYLVLARPV